MDVKIKSSYADSLAKKLNEIKTINGDGEVSFHALPYKEYLAVLDRIFDFKIKINDWDKSKLIRNAVNAAAQKGNLNAERIEKELNKEINQYKGLRENDYMLVSSLSIKQKGDLFIKRIQLNKHIIILQPRLNENHKEGRNQLTELAKSNTKVKPPTNYFPISIKISGRTYNEAFNNGIDTLDLFRGILNLAYNRGQYMRISWSNDNPVNEIRTGLIHSLHNPDGKLATSAGWYDADFQEAQLVDITPHSLALSRFLKNTVIKLRRSHYRKDIEDSIILYTRALDQTDWNSSFLKLWSLLEKLTGSDRSYETTIRRASFVFEDREYYKYVLDYLKEYRDKFVHHAFNSDEIETYMYLLKACTEALLGFHLGNSFRFKSLQASTEFLELPTDEKTLKHQINLRKYAQQYLKPVKQKL